MFNEPCCCSKLKWDKNKKRHVCKVCKSEYTEYVTRKLGDIPIETSLIKVKEGIRKTGRSR